MASSTFRYVFMFLQNLLLLQDGLLANPLCCTHLGPMFGAPVCVSIFFCDIFLGVYYFNAPSGALHLPGSLGLLYVSSGLPSALVSPILLYFLYPFGLCHLLFPLGFSSFRRHVLLSSSLLLVGLGCIHLLLLPLCHLFVMYAACYSRESCAASIWGFSLPWFSFLILFLPPYFCFRGCRACPYN